MPEIQITIKKDGTTTVKAEGVQGPSCSLHTQPYIRALGKVIRSTPTAEMFQSDTTNEAQVKT